MITLLGRHIVVAHTVLATLAFGTALLIGYTCHLKIITKNEFYGYPLEYFPSVSATIGDMFPERNVFQLIIAVTSAPRFLLLLCYFIKGSAFTAITGLIRTLSCGGWIYVTSSDHHDFHDVAMVAYILLTIPYEASIIYNTTNPDLRYARSLTCFLFFSSLLPLAYFFIQHKVHAVAGAYSIYAFFEWALIILDVAFDAWGVVDLDAVVFKIGLEKTGVDKNVENGENRGFSEAHGSNDSDGVSTPIESLISAHNVAHSRASGTDFDKSQVLNKDSNFKFNFNPDTTANKSTVEQDGENFTFSFRDGEIVENENFDTSNILDGPTNDLTSDSKALLSNLEKLADISGEAVTNQFNKLDNDLFGSQGNKFFDFVELLVNTLNWALFFSSSTALFLCLWYFPLWNMGISGYEATIAVFFIAPVLAFNLPIKSVRSLSVILGLGAYTIESPEYKLLSVTASAGVSLIASINELRTLRDEKYKNYFTSLLLGLFLSSVLKYYGYSNNPIWPVMNKTNGGWNEAALVVGFIAAFLSKKELAYELEVNEEIEIVSDSESDHENTIGDAIGKRIGEERSKNFNSGFVILAAIGLGGYFFNLFTYLTDSSTTVFWVWEGFPLIGPTAITGGIIHLISFAAGILASLILPFTSSIPYTAFGAAGLAVFLLNPGWLGFSGASLYTFYLASIAPVVGQSIIGHNLRLVFFIGFLIFDVLALAGVWTVAYAFVPGGELLREKAELVTVVSFVCLLAGIYNYRLKNRASTSKGSIIQNTLLILTVLLSLSTAVFFKRSSNLPTAPHNAESKSFTTGIWCVHFGIDNDMWSSEVRMMNLIRDAQVDIIGLLETDTQRLIGGNRDFTQKIAEESGMYVDYGPGPNKNTWGAALLSKFPILNSTHHLLPSPVGELAPAIHATLDIYGELVDVVVFHSGQEEDVEDRRLQSLAIEEITGGSNRPLVLLSYLVTKPLNGNYFTYTSEKSGLYDIDSTDWDRWCEYILFKNLKKVAYARISRSTITDTELQIAKFKLLTDEQKENFDEEFLYGNNFIHENEIDENLRMPQKLRGDGVRGHFYHVFDEPRYFAQ